MLSSLGRALFLMLALCAAPDEAKARGVNAGEYCTAVNVYYEARGEPERGMQAVAYVTANRARARHQGLCRVVFAYKQFSWVGGYRALDAHKHLKAQFRPRGAVWQRCLRAAREVLAHPERDFTGGAQFFVAYYIFPQCLKSTCGWSAKLDYVDRYGSHLFFKARASPGTYAYGGKRPLTNAQLRRCLAYAAGINHRAMHTED